MIINLIIWIIISLIVFPIGFSILSFFSIKINQQRGSIVFLIGLLPVVIISVIFAFFFRINLEFFLLLIVISSTIYYIYRKEIIAYIGKKLENKTNNTIIISGLAFIIITAIQSSFPTNIPDDGFYYLQTIKWSNAVGIPLGVAKYGIQYGQFSTWHIIQSIFNFSFFKGNQLNNINGWILIIYTFYFLFNFNKKKNKQNLFSLIALSLTIPFQFFTTAPSPDLPVYVISIIVFDIFLFSEKSKQNLIILSLLSLIAISIKTTSFYLFFIIILQYKFEVLKPKKLIVIISVVAILIILKNIITTGTFIFPFDFYKPTWISWRINQDIINEGNNIIRNYPFMVGYNLDLSNKTFTEKVILWFTQGGYKGAMNIVWTLGLIIVSFVSFFSTSKRIKIILYSSIINFFVLWGLSPYYRFALPIIILNYIILFLYINPKFSHKTVKILIVIILFSNIIWITPIKKVILNISNNNIVNTYYPLKAEYFIIRSKPFVNDKYEKLIFNGEEVFVPLDYNYAWDGPIPCVSKYYFEKYNSK